MDPTANLNEQRQIAALLLKIHVFMDPDEAVDLGNRLAKLVEALDGWISRGGFLPKSWKKSS